MSAMFSDVLGVFEGKFDTRMMVTIFFPCRVFVMILAGLVIAAFAPGPADLVAAWNGYPIEFQAFTVILALCLVLLIALVMSSLMMSVIRLYEDYWDGLPVINAFGEARKQHYRDILDEKWSLARGIRKNAAGEVVPPEVTGPEMLKNYNDIYYRFPAPTRCGEAMPTRLGNILKSAETYPSVRYGVDSVLIWPRLFPSLPQAFAGSITGARSMLDMMVTVSFLGFCLTADAFLWSVAIIAVRAFPWQIPGLSISSAFAQYLWLIFAAAFFGGAVVGYAGYRGAIGAALGYSELIKTAFDLHRGLAIKALGYKPPAGMEEEYGLWSEAGRFIHRNIPGESIKAISPKGGGGDNQ